MGSLDAVRLAVRISSSGGWRKPRQGSGTKTACMFVGGRWLPPLRLPPPRLLMIRIESLVLASIWHAPD